MEEIKRMILALPPDEKLELISFLASALKEETMLVAAIERRERMQKANKAPKLRNRTS